MLCLDFFEIGSNITQTVNGRPMAGFRIGGCQRAKKPFSVRWSLIRKNLTDNYEALHNFSAASCGLTDRFDAAI